MKMGSSNILYIYCREKCGCDQWISESQSFRMCYINSYSPAEKFVFFSWSTHLIRIIGTVIVTITSKTSRDAVPIGTGEILMITGHRFCIGKEISIQESSNKVTKGSKGNCKVSSGINKGGEGECGCYWDMKCYCTICFNLSWRFYRYVKAAITS